MLVYSAPMVVGAGQATLSDCNSFQTFDYNQHVQLWYYTSLQGHDYSQDLKPLPTSEQIVPAVAVPDFPCCDPEKMTPADKAKVKRKRCRGGYKRGNASTGSAANQVSATHKTLVSKTCEDLQPMHSSWGNTADLGQSFDRCKWVITQLESSRSIALPVFEWILPAMKTLAFSKHGCRVIQKAIEVVQPIMGDDHVVIQELTGSIVDLCKDLHGNHVVSKMIEVLPAAHLEVFLEKFSGTAITMARHQYGCRVLERLIENFPPHQVHGLVTELIPEAYSLCCHRYANFVMQHIFEHGLQTWKDAIIEQIGDKSPELARHRIASHVLQSAINHGNAEVKGILVSALIGSDGKDSLLEIACSSYGSFVIAELADIEAHKDQVAELLKEDLCCLIGRRVTDRLGKEFPGRRVAVKFFRKSWQRLSCLALHNLGSEPMP